MKTPTTILLVDGHCLFREAMKQLITAWQEYELVGEAASIEQSLSILKKAHVDIVLTDIDLVTESGFNLIKECNQLERELKVAILTRQLHPEYIREALRQNVLGYMSHHLNASEIRHALADISSGKTHIDPFACKALADDPFIECITDRECDVLTLLGHGQCNASIAQRLGITEKTVKSHVSRLLDKLDMTSRTQLAVFAQSTYLLDSIAPSSVSDLDGNHTSQ